MQCREVALKKLSLDTFFLVEIRMFLLPHIYVFWDKGAHIGIYAHWSFSILGVRIGGFFVVVAIF